MFFREGGYNSRADISGARTVYGFFLSEVISNSFSFSILFGCQTFFNNSFFLALYQMQILFYLKKEKDTRKRSLIQSTMYSGTSI